MKQHATPVVIEDGKTVRLELAKNSTEKYNEQWIQDICFKNPTILPIDEIEPLFMGVVPVCKELNTSSGACDLVYLNKNGYITIAECKLWRNPEARRLAVSQILDYAKDIAKWDYEKFQLECMKSREYDKENLYELLREYHPEIDEKEFIDGVQANLSKGRFLLLIIGDGIQENMENLIAYVQGYGGLNFSLGLIELPIYEHPINKQRLITPRILARTKEIQRTVIVVRENGVNLKVSQVDEKDTLSKTISERNFYERISKTRGTEISEKLEKFILELTKEDLIPKLGKGMKLSMNIKSSDDTYNFASIQENGEVWFYGIVSKTEEIGSRQIGIDYLTQLAVLVDGKLDTHFKQWNWCVKRHSKYIMIDEYLEIKEAWKSLIEDTINQIQKIQEE